MEVGDGRNISFWFDFWVDRDPLCLAVDDINPDEITWSVRDVIDANGSWALQRLKTSAPLSCWIKSTVSKCPMTGPSVMALFGKGRKKV